MTNFHNPTGSRIARIFFLSLTISKEISAELEIVNWWAENSLCSPIYP